MSMVKHPLFNYSDAEKINYLSIVANIAHADGGPTDDEISKLRKLCHHVGVTASGIGAVLGAAESTVAFPMGAALAELQKGDLKFTLVTDMLFIAHADAHYSEDERVAVRHVAGEVGITDDQLASLTQYVEAILTSETDGSSGDDLKKLGREVAASLATAGIPLAAVTASGTIRGMGATGRSAALGLGIASGIGAAVALGVGGFFGARALYKRLART